MITHLSINNYALIRKLNIDFLNGFSVITGETGAGKSILLGAMSLILGNRADSQVLFDKTTKCIIEGTFNIKDYNLNSFFSENDLDYDENTFMRREINKNGKSRAFINDTPVNLNLMKELGDKLVNIHSQNKTITLNNSDFQLAVIDNYVNKNDILRKYRLSFINYSEKKKLLKTLIEKENKSKLDQDYYQFQFDELEKANLDPDEFINIEKELELLNHHEEIKTNIVEISQILENDEQNILSQLNRILSLINNISEYNIDFKEIQNRIESNLIDLKDISAEIDNFGEGINYNPARVEELSSRFDTVIQLQQKHRVNSVEELISLKENLNEKLSEISSLEVEINKLKKEISEIDTELRKLAKHISANRGEVIPKIEKNICKLLSELGIADGRFKVEQLKFNELTIDGLDKVRFLFNANKGGVLSDMSKIASGGELSRLMLSIKSLISQKNLLPTIIFDEIDSGVSGNIANKVGKILKKISGSMQVIAITHLPQIAGMGDSHYLVFKETDTEIAESRIKLISESERINEIAKMLSGSIVSEIALQNAKELLIGKI
ncbi:MAG: DNA repair protein RecN [Bacteroidales bacterium]|nr:DNA repair protein RecN [Bacteroidales bacterium]